MGFTPLEGLMMGTRTGSIDPGILLYLQQRHGLSASELDDALNRRSGLLGVSGVSPDFRKVQAAAKDGNPRAILALEIYADRIRAAIGALTTTLGGIDALVFTAGVGENNAELRATVCAGLEHLGLRLDASKNIACKPDQDISSRDAPGRVLVIRTREALMIARVVRRLLSREPGFSATE
jgi:acetate kinase